MSCSNQTIYHKTVQGYDLTAQAFSQTRDYFWSDLAFIKHYYGKNDKLLDYGCGNGRLIDFLKPLPENYLGVDASRAMLKQAQKKYPDYVFGKVHYSGQTLTKIKQKFDLAVSLGVFHHFPAGPTRQLILKRLVNLLKPGGFLIITVWSLKKLKPAYQKLFLNQKQAYIPFKDSTGKTLFKRFIYNWNASELACFIKNRGLTIVKKGVTKRNNLPANLFCIAKKTKSG
ncbi:MAG: methyltransferase domain-containing protein [Candidatus Moranbacteria bacterium]|nr:methyltransferase domain-containing protein [Candidatus Moranbacteria bacterium]